MDRKLQSFAFEDGYDVQRREAPSARVQSLDTDLRTWERPVDRLVMVHDIAIVSLEGEIGIPEYQYLSELMTSLKRKGYVKLVLSFSDVEHLNYRVFEELMGFAKHLRDVSGDLRFSEINHYLYHILLFVGADQTIDSYRNVEEAILSFHNTHGRRWH